MADNTEQDASITDLGTAEVVAHKPTEAPIETPTLAPEIKKIDVAIKPIVSQIPYPDTQALLEKGEQTSSFATGATKDIKSLGTAAIGAAGQVMNTGAVIMNQGAQYMGLATSLTSKVISSFTEIITQKTVELGLTAVTYTVKWPIDMNKYAMSYFNSYVGPVTKEAMKKGGLTPEAFDKLKTEEKEKQEEESKDEEKKKGTKLQTDGIKKLKNKLQDIQTGLASVTDHMAEGPTWVSNKANEFINKYTDDINKTLDKYKNSIITWEQTTSKQAGEQMGKEMLDEESEKAELSAKKLAEKAEKLKKKAETKAKNQTALAKIKLAALIGI